MDSSEEDSVEVEQALISRRFDKGKGRTDATLLDDGPADLPGANGTKDAVLGSSTESAVKIPARSTSSASYPPRPQQAQGSMLSSSPWVESASDAGQERLASSPSSAEPSSQQTPARPPKSRRASRRPSTPPPRSGRPPALSAGSGSPRATPSSSAPARHRGCSRPALSPPARPAWSGRPPQLATA